MTKRCLYCWWPVSDEQIADGKVVKVDQVRYAHVGCIDSYGKENTMSDQTQHILGAADSAHQGIELARSLLQESLGNMGEILAHGCMNLGPASLGSAMRLGQLLKEGSFLLGDLLKDAHGLCVLLGKDLGVCEDIEGDPASEGERGRRAAALWYKSSRVLDDENDPRELACGDGFSPMDVLDSDDLAPREDEFDDDEIPL